MGQHEPVRIVDLWDVRLRVGTVRFGVWITVAICSVGVGYAFATWDSPHRTAIAALLALAIGSALVVAMLDAEKIVRSRWREVFFIGWSLVDIALIASLVVLDGGARSPIALIYFMPIIFAALSYPLPAVWAIALIDVATCVGVGAVAGNPDWSYLIFFGAALACAATLCVWQARNHDKQRKDLALISRTDPLTGALNRRGFEERLDAELGESVRSGRALTLVLLDLDDFKVVNDTRGHAAGDELLCWVVSTVREALRPFDAVGRLGGDEFAIALPGAARADALEVAARVRDTLTERVFAAMGVATFPIDGADREELHQRADAELYAAKHGAKFTAGPAPRDLRWAATLAQTVDRRMTPAEDHSSAVARYATAMGRHLGWDGEELSLLGIAGMLHDVGKVAVPDRILTGSGELTADELDRHVRSQPELGAALVGRVEGLEPTVAWIRSAHEHWDGSGYPDGLSGEAIPMGSRILHVADAFASMTGRRSYRDPLSADAALDELQRNAGTQFDPACVRALAAHLAGSTAGR
ncbi:MAG TPA: HD domain-containing phosphohydrolase [Candidatus Dormibacteraeota bacterium]|nr:HD domain-containing phosphohydrolase [Candidatus Dormibacteraeota bacterium]